jgi:hypothetical protein
MRTLVFFHMIDEIMIFLVSVFIESFIRGKLASDPLHFFQIYILHEQ